MRSSTAQRSAYPSVSSARQNLSQMGSVCGGFYLAKRRYPVVFSTVGDVTVAVGAGAVVAAVVFSF